MLKYMVLALMALGWTTVNAQGYFDFDQVPGLAGGPKVQIDLNPVMLGFVREAARIADADAATAIEGIEGVRVRVYEVEDDAGPLFDFIDDASQRLEAEGWQRMVYVQDEDARVRVYVSFIETRMSGLTVMVAGSDDDEAVFINLLGEIDPAKLGRAAAALGVDQLIPNFGVEQTEPIGGAGIRVE